MHCQQCPYHFYQPSVILSAVRHCDRFITLPLTCSQKKNRLSQSYFPYPLSHAGVAWQVLVRWCLHDLSVMFYISFGSVSHCNHICKHDLQVMFGQHHCIFTFPDVEERSKNFSPKLSPEFVCGADYVHDFRIQYCMVEYSSLRQVQVSTAGRVITPEETLFSGISLSCCSESVIHFRHYYFITRLYLCSIICRQNNNENKNMKQ